MHAGRDDYLKVLNTNGIYSEVHEFENSPHSFCLFNPWFEPTIGYIDGFLKKFLSHDPVEVSQLFFKDPIKKATR
ncbi:hypothetical protein [Flavobacterium nitratireducens]|uniref:hypothetical protein n=1 Tax=Flavobacterium nitratireducens TaxID=992289 RepID=UPI0024152F08|nr:hypothetical protein [Flavobacterium nitratireducens]